MMNSVSPPVSFSRVPLPPPPPPPRQHSLIHSITQGRRRRRRRRRTQSSSSSRYNRCFKVVVVIVINLLEIAVEIRRHDGFFLDVHGITFLAKTKETFRLAELQKLEARVMMMSWETSMEENGDDDDNSHEPARIDRLLVDQSTGSSLFRIESMSDSENYPFLEKRCDWIGHVIVEGRDVAEMIDRLLLLLDRTNEKMDIIKDGWSLDYIRMYQPPKPNVRNTNIDDEDTDGTSNTDPAATTGFPRQSPRHRGQTNKKSAICAVANVISSRPALYLNDVTTKLLIVDCSSSGDDDDDNDEEKETGCYLVRIIDHQKPKQSDGIRNISHNATTNLRKGVWSKRPFQYSSALNFEVAEVIIDMLLSAVVSSSRRCSSQPQSSPSPSSSPSSLSLHLLDPTCGSGTLLAMALSKGFQYVEGCDINPSCVDGTIRNLQYVFGSNVVEAKTHVSVRDCSIDWTSSAAADKDDDFNVFTTTPPSCVVANLPWGQNTISYVNENRRILNAIRGRLSKGTFCVFIIRPDIDVSYSNNNNSDDGNGDCSSWKNYGFDEIGHAYIPQRDFVVPKGRRKEKKKNSESGTTASATSTQPDPSLCLVSVVVAT